MPERDTRGIVSSFSSQPWFGAAAGGLFLAVLLSTVLVDHDKAGWGVRSRLALVFAVVDEGRFSIDSYHAVHPTTTGDKAFYEGHFYSDKIFGVSLLALPIYASIRALGFEPQFQFSKYMLRVFAVSIPAALSVVFLWALMVQAGAAPQRALMAAAFTYWGSLWFGFSTVFFPYAPGIACTSLALWLILYPWPSRMTTGMSFAIGSLCGFAMLCDLVFGLLVVGLAIVFSLRVVSEAGVAGAPGPWPALPRSRHPATAALPKFALGAAGGVIPLALFAAYTTVIFGRPSIPYSYLYQASFPMEAQGFFGITVPRPGPLWFLTLHPFRGLFFWSPILALAVVGLVAGVRATGIRRLQGWLGLSSLAAYLAFNASHQMWWGGDAMGPRLMLPLMVVLPLGLVEFCRPSSRRRGWIALCLLGAVSILASAPLSLQGPETPPGASYEVLHAATAATSIAVPQFEQWSDFFALTRFRDAAGRLRDAEMFPLAVAVLLPAWLLTRASRRLSSQAEAAASGPS